MMNPGAAQAGVGGDPQQGAQPYVAHGAGVAAAAVEQEAQGIVGTHPQQVAQVSPSFGLYQTLCFKVHKRALWGGFGSHKRG
jgi:hypothetical protein